MYFLVTYSLSSSPGEDEVFDVEHEAVRHISEMNNTLFIFIITIAKV